MTVDTVASAVVLCSTSTLLNAFKKHLSVDARLPSQEQGHSDCAVAFSWDQCVGAIRQHFGHIRPDLLKSAHDRDRTSHAHIYDDVRSHISNSVLCFGWFFGLSVSCLRLTWIWFAATQFIEDSMWLEGSRRSTCKPLKLVSVFDCTFPVRAVPGGRFEGNR